MNNKFINGPINIIRIEGDISGINKVLYLMADLHIPLNKQTKCEDNTSINITDYLINKFTTQSDKIIDFFVEIKPRELSKKYDRQMYPPRYIEEVGDLYRKGVTSNAYPNVRFHYIDIREYIFIDDKLIFRKLSKFINSLEDKSISLDDIMKVKDSINIVSSHMVWMCSEIYKDNCKKLISVPDNLEVLSKYTSEDIQKKSVYIINKIMGRYNNSKNKQIITQIVNNELLSGFNDYFSSVKDINNYINNTKEHSIPDIKTHTTIISKNFMYIVTAITDLYSLRRIIDKEYIINSIVYTGIMHTFNYLYFLIKYFDFQITHYSYLKDAPDKIQKLIKDNNSPKQLWTVIYPEILQQCSNISTFPDGF